ncbi:hypothetical protein ACHAWF_000777 [Thalassiosira exigua]
MYNVGVAFKILEDDEPLPVGYTRSGVWGTSCLRCQDGLHTQGVLSQGWPQTCSP